MSDEITQENTGFSHDQIQERDDSIYAPVDEFYLARLKAESLITGPLERADHILSGYGGSFQKPLLAMEQARELVGEAYNEVLKIMDLYETLSRGIIRETNRRREAERKLYERSREDA